MAFFKGNDVVLAEKLDALRNEFKLALLEQKQAFDKELEEMEAALLTRIEQGEKTSRSDSLKADEKKAANEAGQVSPGYRTWTQRKAERVLKTADPGFAQRVLRQSQRTSSNSSAPSTPQTQ